MKICKIICTYSPFLIGGGDMHAKEISEELANRRNSITIITINPTKGEIIEHDGTISIYRFHPFNISTLHNIGKASIIEQGVWTLLDIYSYYSYKKIKTFLKKEAPDIVHLHTPTDLTLAAVNAVKNLRLPLVYTLHDYFLLCRRYVLLHGFKKMCTDKNVNPLCRVYRDFTKRIIDNKIDTVIAPSKFVLNTHRKYGFFKNTKTFVLPNGIRLNDIDNSKDIKTIDNNGRNINILYTGGLTKHKGVSILISAFKQIKNKNLKLHIVGGGIYENDLRCLADNDDRIVFYGKLPKQDVWAFYRMANLSVVPSIWHDVFPTVILEAFKAGIPVIGSNMGGIPELIRNNYNGFLFEAGNIEELKRILENVTNNPERLRELGRNAFASVKKYEMSSYINKLLKVYEDAIEINKLKNSTGRVNYRSSI